MPDHDWETRLRWAEGRLHEFEPRNEDRWRNQLAWNDKQEAAMDQLDMCLRELKTALRVNTVKLGLVFFVVQVVVSAVFITVLTQLVGRG